MFTFIVLVVIIVICCWLLLRDSYCQQLRTRLIDKFRTAISRYKDSSLRSMEAKEEGRENLLERREEVRIDKGSITSPEEVNKFKSKGEEATCKAFQTLLGKQVLVNYRGNELK